MSSPTWQRLLRQLEERIADGALRPGQAVPSHRAAAREWQVSVATVTRVYAEAIRRGWLQARVGRGTVVATPAGSPAPPPAVEGMHDLAANTPLATRQLNARALLRDAFGRLAEGRAHALLDRPGQVLEAPAHVEAAARWLSALGVPADPGTTCIAPGAQPALLVALRSTAGPGGLVACEPLANPGLVAAADFVGVRLLPLAVDDEGPCPEALESLVRRHGPLTLYASPSCSNPLALRWSDARRRALAELLGRHRLWCIEDDDQLALDPRPRPLSHLAPERTILLASLSKLAGFALRTAFVRVPPALIGTYRRHLRAAVWMASPVLAEVTAHWLDSGIMDELVQARRAEALHWQALAGGGLHRHGYRAPPYGVHGWLPLPRPWDAERFAFHARREGVAVGLDPAFRLPGADSLEGVRLSLGSTASGEALGFAIGTLAALLDRGPGPV